MEFLKVVKRRSFISEVIYIALNIGLAIALLVIVRSTGTIWPAFALALLSKWRVFAVRVRFWFANIQANLVSVIVSLSYVVFLYNINIATNVESSRTLATQCALTAIYACWLLFMKPKSSRKHMAIQAGIALFVGVTAVYMMSYDWPASLVVLLVCLIGYATARHVLGSFDEDHISLLSLVWGLVMAEIGWLAYHWTIAYRMPIITNALLPQVSIITLCSGFLAYKAYNSYFHHQKIRTCDVLLPLLFTVSIIAVLTLVFNSVSTSGV
jgi:hypothetical protein